MFLQSMAAGAALTIALAAARRLGPRFLRRRLATLPAGQALRCVRPLDPGGH
jgi:hypothetical protein